MSITIYHKMWGMVSMKEKGMCLASVLLSNRLYLLVCSPVRKTVLSRIQTDLSVTPFSRCVMIGCIHQRSIQGSDKGDRHSFPIEMM